MFSIEQIRANCHTVDRQLLLMIYEEHCETNRLLRVKANEKEQEGHLPSDDDISTAQVDLDSLKRPELMKLMSKLSDKPQGWNKWETDDMRRYLRGDNGDE